jgi:hypothetical protein
MIVFFTFLTFYSAYFDVVKTGCFGDALKLKPWESFMKDVLLFFHFFYSLIKISKTFCKQRSKHHNLRQYHLMYVSGVWVLNHLPLIDLLK